MKISISSKDDILKARSKGKTIAEEIGFGITDQTKIATAISELARNAITFAGVGTLTINVIEKHSAKGIEIICKDEGPGIEDVEKALEAGYSTRDNALGKGLSGTKRLMDEFKIESKKGEGTKVVIKKWL